MARRLMKVAFPYTRSYRDRHGKTRIEYRRGGRTFRLRAAPGTAEFQAEYDAIHETFERRDPSAQRAALARVHPGTVRALVVDYLRSVEFEQLSATTQRARRLIFEAMLREPINPKSPLIFADCPITRFGSRHVKTLRDRKSKTPEAANIRVKVLRGLFKWALDSGRVALSQNPARDVGRLRVREDGYHSWTEDEREQYECRHRIGSKARLAYALLLYTGQRRSDVVLFGRQHVRSGMLCFTQQKNRNRKPIALELPILPELRQVIDASPVGDFTFLVNDFGKPFAVAGFGNKFRQWCNEAGLPPHCSAHGLRKAAASTAAENGATAYELMSIFGWLSLKEAERYTRAAERKRLAARGMGTLVRIKARTPSV